ncbi:MAG TPA: amidohydrolase, partial [Vicinamibacterales bacterium]|nr:amidohydrolase [Vicinamibacterales bacterium]
MATRLAALLVVAIVGTTLIAGLIVGAQRDDSSGPVDLIIHNARVYAADDLGSIADAVAIRGNKILKVGGEREIMRYRRPQTSVIDARGAAVLPGFDDAHVSLIAGGLRDGVRLDGAQTLDELQSRITEWAEARPDAAWITGGGWSYDAFTDQPVRAQLDAAIADRPARLLSADGEALWVNTRALQAARITRKTANPKNGTIVRDRRGEPTGLLQGAAMSLVERVVAPPTREERAHALQLAMREAARYGITSVQDVGAAPGDLDLYDAARDAGTLSLRVYAAVDAAHTPIDDLDAIAKRFPDDPLLKTGLATIDLDGSVASSSAALLAPYAARNEGDGVMRMPAAQLDALVAALDARGWQIAIDAAGDRSVRAALDAYGAVAKSARGARPARHRIENLSLIDAEDIPRFGSLGIVASIQPLHATIDGLETWSKALGPERVPFGWAARGLSAAGAHVAFGSDWPILKLEPLDAIRAAVRRPDMHASQALTLKSAINAWTSGAAWASFDDHRKGTLKPGMLADLVVLS